LTQKFDVNECSDAEDVITDSKGDDEGIFVARASASYIHSLREILGRKILYSITPKADGKNHSESVRAPIGMFIDVNHHFNVITVDEILYAESKYDNFLVRCSDNAAFSAGTGDFIGYWQNEGHILTD
jgi:hypothetical protein